MGGAPDEGRWLDLDLHAVRRRLADEKAVEEVLADAASTIGAEQSKAILAWQDGHTARAVAEFLREKPRGGDPAFCVGYATKTKSRRFGRTESWKEAQTETAFEIWRAEARIDGGWTARESLYVLANGRVVFAVPGHASSNSVRGDQPATALELIHTGSSNNIPLTLYSVPGSGLLPCFVQPGASLSRPIAGRSGDQNHASTTAEWFVKLLATYLEVAAPQIRR